MTRRLTLESCCMTCGQCGTELITSHQTFLGNKGKETEVNIVVSHEKVKSTITKLSPSL